MQVPVETKPVFWGAVGGAIAMAVVGFAWGGWVTAGKAEANATDRANAAVVTALAPFCVEKFNQASDASDKLVELKKADSWTQVEFVEKGGWAASTASQASGQVTAVARACATLLVG